MGGQTPVDVSNNMAPPQNSGVMVAIYPPDNIVQELEGIIGKRESVIDPLSWHITLAYLGDSDQYSEDQINQLVEVVAGFASTLDSDFPGTVNGIGRFSGDEENEEDTMYANPDVPGLPELRQALVARLEASGFDVANNHGFTPHISLATLKKNDSMPFSRITPLSGDFGMLSVAVDDDVWDFAFGEQPQTYTTVPPELPNKAGGLDRNRGNAEKLRHYWTRGEGAAKIRWGTHGDWTRCVAHLTKYLGPRAKGYCNLRHKEMNGFYPGSKLNKADDLGLITTTYIEDTNTTSNSSSYSITLNQEEFSTKDGEAVSLEYKTTSVAGFKVLSDEEGIVETIVSVTGLKDRVSDVIEPGAYEKTLQVRTPKGVWSHAWDKPISKTEEVKELMPGDPRLPKKLPNGEPWPRDAGGLLIKTRFNLGTQRGRDAYSDVTFFGDEQEWSIGYQVPTGGAEVKDGIRYIKTLDLYEYSPVLFGAMPAARTQTVKDAQIAFKALNGVDLDKWVNDIETFVKANSVDEDTDPVDEAAECVKCGGPIKDGICTKCGTPVNLKKKQDDWHSDDDPFDSEEKAGRVLSGKNASLIRNAIDALQALLDAATTQPSEETTATKDADGDFEYKDMSLVDWVSEVFADNEQLKSATQAFSDAAEAGDTAQIEQTATDLFDAIDSEANNADEETAQNLSDLADAVVSALEEIAGGAAEGGAEDATPTEEPEPEGKAARTFSQDRRDTLASEGAAMPDGSYPIPDKDALRRAIQSFGRAKNPDAVRKHIIKRARALDAMDMLPESWNVTKAIEDIPELKEVQDFLDSLTES